MEREDEPQHTDPSDEHDAVVKGMNDRPDGEDDSERQTPRRNAELAKTGPIVGRKSPMKETRGVHSRPERNISSHPPPRSSRRVPLQGEQFQDEKLRRCERPHCDPPWRSSRAPSHAA